MAALLSLNGKERLRERALGLGFKACGFSSAAALSCEELLEAWLERGRHGTMDYLARNLDRRTRPSLALPDAASVIVVAWPYLAPPPRTDWRERLTGRIAAYALGLDYHTALADKLEALAHDVADVGASTRVHVDAGPLVEKDLARRAGLGWFGRNTNILSKELGSYFLIGCLVTDLRIEPDAAFSDNHCGSCRDCQPACPTGALDSGPTIDAPRCISYLTIEHRGPIAPELRAPMGNWVFGCDDCQTVCPWNRPTAEPEEALEPSLPGLLELNDESFSDLYGHTAVARAKRRGLARNAAIALGNTGNPDALPALERALMDHDEPLVRAHAAWALGQLATASARATLAAAASREPIPPVCREIAGALELLG